MQQALPPDPVSPAGLSPASSTAASAAPAGTSTDASSPWSPLADSRLSSRVRMWSETELAPYRSSRQAPVASRSPPDVSRARRSAKSAALVTTLDASGWIRAASASPESPESEMRRAVAVAIDLSTSAADTRPWHASRVGASSIRASAARSACLTRTSRSSARSSSIFASRRE
ncbi:uncharacterized protein AMSG_11634 [Thecamonas trahens ATCC 50062]|uniref:Uncharacterized protein n=1 Tax=Thecamonas trahens ATCC 50062 TaxID=461836 RepID=A0A0L0DLF2_THETB|nr:hypothetical protein AMSG_11634 [Thecamonas trahens ATCC 50062]KNC52223.1 hypothetical protein AMSG_11634 [Thecamonas trahens ATCC 50062]|eukprot:XP_013762330.1 hypothetical protein AMSG_11634 [Thecamonas trahens ATCC 50062]